MSNILIYIVPFTQGEGAVTENPQFCYDINIPKLEELCTEFRSTLFEFKDA